MTPLRDAAESATAGVPVVRGLRWTAKGSDYEADSEYGQYVISMDAPTAGGAANLWMAGADVDTFEVFPTRLAAQIAAEVDYGRRPILSELDTARAEIERLRVQGNWAALHDVLNYLNTLEERVVAKKDIYAAVMEMRPHPPISQDENFQDYHDGVVSALVERMNATQSALTAAQARIAETVAWCAENEERHNATAKEMGKGEKWLAEAHNEAAARIYRACRDLLTATLSPAVKEPK